MCRLLLLLYLFVPGIVYGQKYMYVNTDNLVVRDRMDRDYNVNCIAHAPTRVEVLPPLEYFQGHESLAAKFCYIRFHYLELNHYSTTAGGYVEKKYLVSSLAKISVPGADTTLTVSVTQTPYYRHKWHQHDHSNHDMGMEYSNARDFRSPVYKGGNPLPLPPKNKPKVYHGAVLKGQPLFIRIIFGE